MGDWVFPSPNSIRRRAGVASAAPSIVERSKLFNFAKQIRQDTLERNGSCSFTSAKSLQKDFSISSSFIHLLESISEIHSDAVQTNSSDHVFYLRVCYVYLVFCKYFISKIELRVLN